MHTTFLKYILIQLVGRKYKIWNSFLTYVILNMLLFIFGEQKMFTFSCCNTTEIANNEKKPLPSDNKQSPNIISLQVITPLISLCKTLLSLTQVIRASANLAQQEMFTGAQRWKNGIGALVIQEKKNQKKNYSYVI